jgi:hypothetical protein
MNKTPDWVIFATIIVGGGLTQLQTALGALLPKQTAIISSVVGCIVALAGFALLYYKAKNAPAQAIVANAPIVTPSGMPTGAENVTTTTTDPIQAPARRLIGGS